MNDRSAIPILSLVAAASLLVACGGPAAPIAATYRATVTAAPALTVLPTTSGIPIPTRTVQPESSWTTYSTTNDVHDIAFDSNGDLWVASTGGVAKWNLADGSYIKYTTEDGLPDNGTLAITIGAGGTACVALSPTSLARFDGQRWTHHTLTIDRQTPDHSTTSIQPLYFEVAPDCSIWSVEEVNLDPQNDMFTKLQSRVTHFDGQTQSIVADGHVFDVAPDSTVWIGSHTGLAYFDGQQLTTYSTADGLPSNEVVSIAALPGGSVWVGTPAGLAYFDHQTWTSYTTADGLPDNLIRFIAVAPDNTIWVAAGLELAHFDGQTWTSFSFPTTAIYSFPGTDDRLITDLLAPDSVVVAPDGSLWFGLSYAVFRFDSALGEWMSWRKYTTPDLPGLTVNTLGLAPDGKVWIGMEAGLTYLDGQAWKTYQTTDALPSNDIDSIFTVPDGTVWIGTENGVTHFDGQSWMTYGVHQVQQIVTAPNGTIWGRSPGGVFRIDGQTFEAYDYFAPNAVDYNAIAVALDSTVWIATDWGVLHFDGQTWTEYSYTSGNGWLGRDVKHFDGQDYTPFYGSPVSYADSILVAPDGTIWVTAARSLTEAYNEGSLAHFDGEKWTTYSSSDLGLPGRVHSMIAAPDGTVWVEFGGGLARFDGQSWTTYTPANGLPGTGLFDLRLAPDDTAWINVWDYDHQYQGAARFNGQAWTTYTRVPGSPDHRLRYIAAIAQDGIVWFVTDHGLARFDGQTWSEYTTGSDGLTGDLQPPLVTALDGTAWVDTSDGLAHFDGHKWTTHTTANGLPSNEVQSIAVTPHGVTWVGTPAGLARFNNRP